MYARLFRTLAVALLASPWFLPLTYGMYPSITQSLVSGMALGGAVLVLVLLPSR
jgi:hypothetical protein